MGKSLGQIRYEAHHGTAVSWAQLPLEEWQRWEKLARQDIGSHQWLVEQSEAIQSVLAHMAKAEPQEPAECLYVEAMQATDMPGPLQWDELSEDAQAALRYAVDQISAAQQGDAPPFDPYAAVFGPAYVKALKKAERALRDKPADKRNLSPRRAAVVAAHSVATRARWSYDNAVKEGAVQPPGPRDIVEGAGGGGEGKGGGHG